MHYDLGYFDLEQETLQTLDNPFGRGCHPYLRYVLLPMSPGWTMKSLARSEGFEPPTPRFEVWCSIQLSYER
jgi:hypothetical protein